MDETTFEQWKALVEFLGAVLGNTVEILLEVPNQGIIAVHGDHLFGHAVGQPLTPQTADVIQNRHFVNQTTHIGSSHHPGTGQPLRQYQYFLKDSGNVLLAVLTVTSDISEYVTVIKSLSKLAGLDTPHVPEIPIPKDDKHGAISSALVEMGLSHVEPHRLTEPEIVELIRLLYQHGVFQARGAVAEIARQLQISESTVYRHLTAVTRHQKAEQRKQQKSGDRSEADQP